MVCAPTMVMHVVGAQASLGVQGSTGDCALQAERPLGPAGRACPSASPGQAPVFWVAPPPGPAHFPPAGSFPWRLGPALPTAAHPVGFQDSPELHTPTPLWAVALTPSCSTVGSPLLALLPVSEWLLCLSLSLWPFHLLWAPRRLQPQLLALQSSPPTRPLEDG